MYFIGAGRVAVQIELPEGRSVRICSIGSGALVGEIALYLGQIRSASVVAEWPTRAYRLSAAALRRMEEADAGVAAAFHQYVARYLARRLADTNALLKRALN